MSITDEERRALIAHRIDKAYEAYEDAKFAFDANRLNTAANRLYYALFHACGALLLSKGIEANRHSGMRAMIALHYIKTNILRNEDSALIYDIFSIRQQCDYDDFAYISKEKIEIYFLPTKDLIDRIAGILDVSCNTTEK